MEPEQPKVLPKIIQITIGQWDQDDRKNTFSVIALADDGGVYRFEKGVGAWVPLPRRILSRKAYEKLKKEKYSAGSRTASRSSEARESDQ